MSRLSKEIEEAKKRRGLCDACSTRPAVKKKKGRDGVVMHLCEECYAKT
jgi:hypothetical protein